MKKAIHIAILFFTVQLFQGRIAHAQGTLFLSNLGQNSFGSFEIANNIWLAQGVETGTDAGGYSLNSIQLEMGAATGNPSGFSVSIYSDVSGEPSADLGNLSGSSNPSSAGVYTYSASSLMLAPSTDYFIVATAATPSTQGTYNWVGDSPTYTSVDGWLSRGDYSSANGSVWTGLRTSDAQIGIYATAIPEPSTWILCLLGGGVAFHVRARRGATSQAKLN